MEGGSHPHEELDQGLWCGVQAPDCGVCGLRLQPTQEGSPEPLAPHLTPSTSNLNIKLQPHTNLKPQPQTNLNLKFNLKPTSNQFLLNPRTWTTHPHKQLEQRLGRHLGILDCCPAPYTPHPSTYTLHSTPKTLHPTPYTLHPLSTPYTDRGNAPP